MVIILQTLFQIYFPATRHQTFFFSLRYNDFIGLFPDTINKLTIQHEIDLIHNKFDEIHYFSESGLYELRLDSNKFTFSDIIPFFGNINPQYFFFKPQDSVLSAVDTTIIAGSDFVMDSWVDTCNMNRYSWTKNGNWLNWMGTTPLWVITNATFADSGNYSCMVSNTLTVAMHLPNSTHVKAAIFNLSGQKVKDLINGEFSRSDQHFSLEGLKDGLYLFFLTTDKKQYSKKIIITHSSID